MGTARLVAAIALLLGLAALVYFWRVPVERVMLPEYPDSAAISAALESAYVRIGPLNVETARAAREEGLIRFDYLRLDRTRSLLRANLEITRAVEKAGGTVLYGIESYDEKRRKQFLNLGVGSGDSLMCEVRLEKRIR